MTDSVKIGSGFNLCEVEGLLECEHSRRELDMALHCSVCGDLKVDIIMG